MTRTLGGATAVVARGAALWLVALCSAFIATPPAESATLARSASPPAIYLQDPDIRRTSHSVAVLLKRLRRTGSLPVIVGLRMSIRPYDVLSDPERVVQRQALRSMQDGVVARLLAPAPDKVKRYNFIPFMAFTVDEAQFQKLLSDPDVASIQEDMAVAPQQQDPAVPSQVSYDISLIHDDYVLSKYKVSGTGQVIAVLDTGVAKTHPMLAGKVVSEACYSTNNSSTNTSSLCPGGASQSTAKGSGVNCPVSIRNCDHGTHVASIAAGAQVGSLRGVASGSKIIAIQVFSQINSAAQCGGQAKTPCIADQTSDLILGLQRVYSLRNKYKIAAVNMSLGSGVYSSDCDSQFPAEAAAFAQLRGAGIAPVAASGNDGSDAGVSYPSCISTAITVGSSSQGDKQKQVEYVSKFSNMSGLVELMAPGENIRAAVPSGSPCAGGGDPYCTKSGTSSAAPHVAGAIAVMRQANPAATVDGIANALECSGKIVELTGDTASPRRLAKPRIDMLGAYNWLMKVPTRSWSFQNSAQAFDWTPFNQAWSISAGRYAPQGPYPADYSYAAISSTANCDLSLDVTAAMTRHYPQGNANDDFPLSGLRLKSQFNYQSRSESGYFFSYTYFPHSAPANRGFAGIFRIDSGSFTTLCSNNKNVPVKYNQPNTVRAVSDDSTHTLYLNGKRVCSAPNDGVYGPGPVSVVSAFSTLWAPTGGTFNVDSVKITSKKAGAGSRETDRPALTVSDATMQSAAPSHAGFAISAP